MAAEAASTSATAMTPDRDIPVDFAPAKVNLTLHLRGQRADGYHLLDSLVVFPGIGDRLWAEPASGLSLTIDGPHGIGLGAGADNLVLRAAEMLSGAAGPGAALRLEKNLPVASGIGGGSSDAAAAVRLLARMWSCRVPDGLCGRLGADVPVCLGAPRAQRMQGIGDRLTPAPALPDFWIVLVNPMIGVETRAVFAATENKHPPSAPEPPAEGWPRFADLADWLRTQRNDLAPGALRVCPVIGDVLAAVSRAPASAMSGSGATCYAVLPDQASALALAERIRQASPAWWVAAGPVPARPAAQVSRDTTNAATSPSA